MTTIEKARQVSAQAWCDPETSGKVMDPVLCEAFAKRLAVALDHLNEAVEAALWMSGSNDFSVGGKAEVGWAKTRPAVLNAARYFINPAAPPPSATAAPAEEEMGEALVVWESLPDRDDTKGRCVKCAATWSFVRPGIYQTSIEQTHRNFCPGRAPSRGEVG